MKSKFLTILFFCCFLSQIAGVSPAPADEPKAAPGVGDSGAERNGNNLMSSTKIGDRAMYFKLRDMLFEIEKAQLKFHYYDEAEARRWPNQQPGIFLVIGVDTKENELNGRGCAPWLRHNGGIKIDISHWTELEGKQWIFNNAHDETHNEAGFLGLFEEEEIKKCRLEIIKRSGRKFTILWSGIGDVFYDDEYGSDVSFECKFVAEFKGIAVQQCVADQTEKGLRETLGKIINLDDFKLVDTNIGLKEFVFK